MPARTSFPNWLTRKKNISVKWLDNSPDISANILGHGNCFDEIQKCIWTLCGSQKSQPIFKRKICILIRVFFLYSAIQNETFIDYLVFRKYFAKKKTNRRTLCLEIFESSSRKDNRFMWTMHNAYVSLWKILRPHLFV